MKSYIIFSNNNIDYLYTKHLQKLIVLNPILKYLINQYELDANLSINPQQLFDLFDRRNDITTYNYYILKFNFLKESGVFDEIENKDFYKGKLNVNDVYNNLSNLRQITFEMTENCNLDCVYCGYGKLYSNNLKRDRKNLDFETAKAIIDRILDFEKSDHSKSAKHNIYISFYGGEPLLCMDTIEKIINYINEKSTNFLPIYTMTTNGILLDKYANFLIKNDIKLLISLDGNKKNNKLRVNKNGKDEFERIVSNIDKIRDIDKNYFKNNIAFNSVLHTENSVQEIHAFFKNKFDKMPSIAEMNSNGVDSDCKQEFEEIFNDLFESTQKNPNKNKFDIDMGFKSQEVVSIHKFMSSYMNFTYNDYNDLLFDYQKSNYIPTGTCTPFERKVFITASGYILPCEKIGTKNYSGSIINGKFHFNVENYVETLNSIYDKISNRCRNCYLAESCPQCIHYLEKNNCKFFMDANRFSAFLSLTIRKIERLPELRLNYQEILNELTID